MSEDATEPEPVETPQVRTIRQLARLMQRYDMTAIDLGEGANKIRLRRRILEPTQAGPAPTTPPPTPAYTPATPPPPAAAPAPTVPAAEAPRGVFIESPMVGTFYSAGTPDSPPLVSVNSVVHKDSTVCIIEAMKVFTEIPAGIAGTIAEVMVKNGQLVEYGQPLFRVEPS